MKKILVVSPCYSCGVGLLWEVFLRLGIQVVVDNQDAWRQVSSKHWRPLTVEAESELLRHVKFQGDGDGYWFSGEYKAVITHRLELLRHPEEYSVIILWVRDPIDSIFSWHRRFKIYEHEVSFESYLSSANLKKVHLNYRLFELTPTLQFAAFCKAVMEFADSFNVLRYEDLKSASPLEWIEDLRNVGIQVEDVSKRTAFFEFFDSKPEVGHAGYNEVNPKGKIFEYLERMSEDCHDKLFSLELEREVFYRMGYTRTAPISANITYGNAHDEILKRCIKEFSYRHNSNANAHELIQDLLSIFNSEINKELSRLSIENVYPIYHKRTTDIVIRALDFLCSFYSKSDLIAPPRLIKNFNTILCLLAQTVTTQV
jgi:hypothetical protein